METLFLRVAAMVPIVGFFMLFANKRRYIYGLLFLSFFALDLYLLRLPGFLEINRLMGLSWNWWGKVFSIAWVLAFWWLSPFSREDLGLTLKLRKDSFVPARNFTIMVLLVRVLIGIFMAIMGFNAQMRTGPVLETILFQATMPGFAEELTFQGVFLLLMILALGKTSAQATGWNRTTVPAALVVATAFGFVHVLNYGNGIGFDFVMFVYPFALAMVNSWLRLKTGSLLFPIIVHNGTNLIDYFLMYLLGWA